MCYSRPIILRCISSQYISYCFICHQCISYCSICCQYISCNQFPGGDCVDCTVLCVGTICVLKRLKQTIHKTRQHTQGTTNNKTQTRYDTHYSHNKTHTRYDAHYSHKKTQTRYDAHTKRHKQGTTHTTHTTRHTIGTTHEDNR